MTLTASMRRGLAAAAWLALAGAATAAAADVDVLDRPARTSALAATRPITALAHAGHRIVAVGQRGHVLLSDDETSGASGDGSDVDDEDCSDFEDEFEFRRTRHLVS